MICKAFRATAHLLPKEVGYCPIEPTLQRIYTLINNNRETCQNCYLRTIELDRRIQRLENYVKSIEKKNSGNDFSYRK